MVDAASAPFRQIALVLILAAGVWARLFYAQDGAAGPLDRTPDEPMYIAYAAVVAHEGPVQGTRLSVAEFNHNPKIQIFPLPTRVGYLYPLAASMRLSGRSDIALGITFSMVISILSLFVLTGTALRLFGMRAGLLAALLMGFSPMELALSRKAWQDGLVTLAAGLVLYTALEVLRSGKTRGWIAAFTAAGLYLSLVKESGLVFTALTGLGAAAALFKDRRRDSVLMLLGTAAAGALWCVCVSFLSGGAAAARDVFVNFAGTLRDNRFVAEYQSGSVYQLPASLLLLSPLTTLVIAAAAIWALFSKDRYASLVAGAVLGFSGLACALPSFKDLRLLSPVFIGMYLLAGWALDRVSGPGGTAPARAALFKTAAVLILAAGLACADAWSFREVFVEAHAKTLVYPLLREHSPYLGFLR